MWGRLRSVGRPLTSLRKISLVFVITCRFQPSFCSFFFFFFLTPLIRLISFRGQRKDQRRRPVRLWGAGGEDPPDSGAVGERQPGSEVPAGRAAAGRRPGLRRVLLHTLRLPPSPGKERGAVELHRSFEEKSLSERSAAPSRLCFICTPPLPLTQHWTARTRNT